MHATSLDIQFAVATLAAITGISPSYRHRRDYRRVIATAEFFIVIATEEFSPRHRRCLGDPPDCNGMCSPMCSALRCRAKHLDPSTCSALRCRQAFRPTDVFSAAMPIVNAESIRVSWKCITGPAS